jgi:SAM-dependent methyltransferase
MTSTAERIAAVASRAAALCPHLETWPTHFHRRAVEMGAMSRVYDFAQARTTLELGCGNAIASALIADEGTRGVATDLFRERVETHSINLHRAQELLKALALTHCTVAAASGYALPFADRTFDLVFSLFALEHIPDRPTTLAEIARVLAPGGVTVHAVPGAMWALAAPIRFPFYLFRRALARVIGRPAAVSEHQSTSTASSASATPAGGRMTWSLFHARYPAFPLPPPHGEYRSYLDELRAYRRSAWVTLFEQNGFDVLACAPINILSLEPLLRRPGAFGRRWFALDQWLSSRPAARIFGQFYVVVARPKAASCR